MAGGSVVGLVRSLWSRMGYRAAGRAGKTRVRKVLVERSRRADDAVDQFARLMWPVDVVPAPNGDTGALPLEVVGTFCGGVITVSVPELPHFLGQALPHPVGQGREHLRDLVGSRRLDVANDVVVGFFQHAPRSCSAPSDDTLPIILQPGWPGCCGRHPGAP